jgi:hypothetical protein
MAYLTEHARRAFEWNEVIYQPVRVRRPSLQHPEVERVLRSGLPVPVERLEHALVDVLDRPDLGPLEIAAEHLRYEPTLSLGRVLARARLLARPILNARLGYVLCGRLDVTRAELAPLERALPGCVAWFDPHCREGSVIPRWRVRVPPPLRELLEEGRGSGTQLHRASLIRRWAGGDPV